jgi:hypothetical protein
MIGGPGWVTGPVWQFEWWLSWGTRPGAPSMSRVKYLISFLNIRFDLNLLKFISPVR